MKTESMLKTEQELVEFQLDALKLARDTIFAAHEKISESIHTVNAAGIDTENLDEKLEQFASLTCEMCEVEAELQEAMDAKAIRLREIEAARYTSEHPN